MSTIDLIPAFVKAQWTQLLVEAFAAEIHITELTGETITRKKDNVTGLSLWNI